MKIPSRLVAIPVIPSPKVVTSADSRAKLVPEIVTPTRPSNRAIIVKRIKE